MKCRVLMIYVRHGLVRGYCASGWTSALPANSTPTCGHATLTPKTSLWPRFLHDNTHAKLLKFASDALMDDQRITRAMHIFALFAGAALVC